jgi:hypothetical protein
MLNSLSEMRKEYSFILHDVIMWMKKVIKIPHSQEF